ncbi:MAG: ribulose-phosphate 3-epimerase [Coriobacteriaceae bacterium]|nr:ribulose-phosphate 3-epimerase [Coriobacteriaceae bacterium]
MYGKIKIAPSILSANFMKMGEAIAMIERCGADIIHVDVMDGHFVPNLTMGVPFLKDLNKIAKLPVDVHLMISNPLEELPWFIAAGAWGITVHYEAFDDPATGIPEAIGLIHAAGIRACVSLKPDTPVEVLRPFIADLDMVLMMSVYPGFSGQSYIEGTEDRVAEVVALCDELGCDVDIQVDGGIKASTVERVARAGADIFVMGSACFTAADPAAAMAEVRELGSAAGAEGAGRR